MKRNEALNVDVAKPVAIGQKESIVIRKIPRYALQSAAGHGFEASIGEADGEILLLVCAHELDVRLPAEADPEIVVHGLVVQEVVLDHVAAVAEAQNEFPQSVVGVDLHDVPEDWVSSDLDHGLGAEFGFFPQAGAESTAQNNDLHSWGSCSAVTRARSGAAVQLSHRQATMTGLRKSSTERWERGHAHKKCGI